MTVLVAFLCLPELALMGFFATGALFSAPAGEPRTVDAVVVLGVTRAQAAAMRGGAIWCWQGSASG